MTGAQAMSDPAGLSQHTARITYRRATTHDIEAIAALHADSWRRHYRGAYSDAFLDGDVFAERLSVWSARLTQPAQWDQCTIVAEGDGAVAGFAHTFLEYDPNWGALLDNLHVRHDLKRVGIGARLMAEAARAVIERTPSSGLFLWVLEGNKSAQAFYDAQGGKCVGREESEPPGGGTVVGLRYVWPDASVLLRQE
jgi:ribosomal protein S18 acetylase RimI-like enzyme